MLRNFGLDRKNAIDGTVVAVSPELCARVRVDQLHCHAHLIARALYAPLQESRNSKLLCYVRYILRMARVLRGGCSRDHLQVVDSCQTREDLVLSSRGEVRVARVRAQVVEWEHGYGFPGRRSGAGRAASDVVGDAGRCMAVMPVAVAGNTRDEHDRRNRRRQRWR